MTFFRFTLSRVTSVALLLTVCSLLVLSSGCSNRGTNAPTIVVEEWGLAPRGGSNQIFDFPGLYFQPQNPTGIQLMTAYLPKESFPPPTGTSRRVPLLVLLAPAFGTQDFYFNTGGLFELVQEMTVKKEIEPMAIVCLGDERSFGGFFYAKSIPGGDYDAILGQQFINAMTNFKGYNIRPERDKHGIGGIGMGAYGAYRQAIINSSVWGSVSGVDGPLDFDGPSGTTGLLSLFDSVVAEVVAPNGINGNFFQRFDTSFAKPYTSLIVSGAFAFSPADTGAVVNVNLIDSTPTTGNPRKFLKIRNRQYVLSDSATLIDSFFTPGNIATPAITVTYTLEGRPFLNFMLPLDSNGNAHPNTWGRWMQNDLAAVHQRVGGAPLTGTSMFLASSDNARFGFGEMTRAWATTVSGLYPGSVQTYEYGGYSGNPATDNQYTYDMLRKMLLFHNEAFKD